MHIIINEEQFKNFIIENIKDEGIIYSYDKNNRHITGAKYDPLKNNNIDTRMFKDNSKEFAVKEKILPKTGVKSFNLYDLKSLDITKIWKKGENRYGDKVNIDSSMDILYKKNIMYITALINKYMPNVDYLLSPSSSSDLNKKIITDVSKHLSNTEILKFGIDIFIKNVRNIQIDYNWLNRVANSENSLSDEELEDLKRRINKWINIDEPIRDFRREIDTLYKEISLIKQEREGKRGRPKVNDINQKYDAIDNYQNAIKDLRHTGLSRGRDSTIDAKTGQVKTWQIKSLEDKVRKAIKGFMTFNPKYNNLLKKFQNKKIVIFDDNISSGATVDDCCLALQKVGVKLTDIIVITLGYMNPTVYRKSER